MARKSDGGSKQFHRGGGNLAGGMPTQRAKNPKRSMKEEGPGDANEDIRKTSHYKGLMKRLTGKQGTPPGEGRGAPSQRQTLSGKPYTGDRPVRPNAY